MHLKTLTLRGFKSFASATTLRLEPGITCVVGPNGSGKSNVVDALAWVMGEQGAKTLRGGQMADVIFAGTSGRPALGRAQVDLTIDNTDGALPIDYSEVTISRTLFRGGGSEYSINGAPARLLDIQELLSDTGMGRQMHVIVGQGQLDAILSSTPEERRGFIEEAAGVLKHRRRKERALRKLADMDANLVRVLDLTNEIHRQLKPLARQARAARRASLVQARVRDAKARLLADDIVRTRERLDAQGENDRALVARREALEAEMAALRADIERTQAEEFAASPRLEEATRAWRELTTVHERLRGTLLAAGERVASRSQEELPPTGEDPDELDRRAAEAGEEDGALLARVEEGRRALDDAIRARERAEEADAAAARELARVNRVIADHRERSARLAGDVASARSRLDSAVVEAQRAEGLVAEAEERARAAQVEAEALAQGVEADGEDGAGEAHRLAVARRDEARAKVDELVGHEREARADRARWEARRDTLAESMTPEDATADLVGHPGVLAMLPELIRVEDGWEDAVAAALASFSDAAVVDGVGVAVDEVRAVHAARGGRIRMLLTSAPASTPATPRPSAPEGTRWARDVVEVPDALAATVAELLEGNLLVADLSDAERLLGHEGVHAIVTREGDVVGRRTALASGRATSSVLTLRAQYDRAREAADEAARREEAARADLVAANAALDEAIHGANEALRALREEDASRARAAQERARASSAAQAASAEAERVRAAAARSAEQVDWAREQLAAAEERAAGADATAPAEDLDEAQSAADAAAAAARGAREAETRARLDLRALEEQSRQVQGRARSLRQAAAREREERQRWLTREQRRRHQLEVATRVRDGARLAVDAAAGALARIEAERASAEEERQRTSRVLAEMRTRADALSREHAEVLGASHRDEIARAEIAMRLDRIVEKALTEIGLEADPLVEEYGPHNLVPVLPVEPPEEGSDPAPVETVPYVRAEQEAALERALAELERIGRVNPLALEEHEAASKRHEFLVSQVQDLKKSKADLLRIIEDVDALVEEAFASAFADTQEQFGRTFATLFPGGEGALVLTDPDDMLTTGIEIEARPAGKKVKRLSLLSGGERSLAALAFLVAIFRARPSPFYVMDEVEAALDDVNLSRLLQVFRDLQETSQLIVITHQKRTMEIADALYGVTMRDGVTRVVSQRLAEEGGAPSGA